MAAIVTLTSAATAENQQAMVQSRLRTVAVREIMTADRGPSGSAGRGRRP